MRLYVASIYALIPVDDHANIETRTVLMVASDDSDIEFEMQEHILKEYPEEDGWYNHYFICDEVKSETIIGNCKLVVKIEEL